MPEDGSDASGGWREERAHQGLESTLPLENEVGAEDVSKILTDGGPDEEEVTDLHMENDVWAAYRISEELDDLYQDNGEYWVLEVSEGDLNPAFVVRDDEIVTHPDYNIEDNTLQWEIDGEEANGHPFGVLSYTGEEDLFANKEFRTADLSTPVDGDQLEKVEQYDRLNGSYLAPGLTEDYRESAEEVINHFYDAET